MNADNCGSGSIPKFAQIGTLASFVPPVPQVSIVARQLSIQFGAVKNSGLLSSHWLENRLRLEPEWTELEDKAHTTLKALGRLWGRERSRVEHYGDEAGLEEKFIQPVFELLGWKIKYQTHLQGGKPDYALFLDDASLNRAIRAGRTTPEYWKHPTVVADAKAWHVRLDQRIEIDNEREFPPQQIERYLDRSQLDFGILTNGRLWRLVPRQYMPQQRRFQTYLECDLPVLLDEWLDKKILVDEFLDFYLFFSPAGYQERDGRKPLITRAIEGSSEYRLGVGESLKQRAFKALELCIEGFLTFGSNGLNARTDLHRCREQSFVLLYRLLFIMFAEDRQLLPYRVNQTYTRNRSMGRHRDEIGSRLDHAKDRDAADYSRDATALWADLHDLFDLVDRGRKAYGVPAYNGGLFDPAEHPFLTENKIADYYLARIIDQLSRAQDPDAPNTGLFRVDYRDLAIQHLGSIYEGLLELRPHHASERMIVVSRRVQGRLDEQVLPASAAIPAGYSLTDTSYRRGTVYLQTDKGERRASGSYYTPDHIVDHIVHETLGPLCKKVQDDLDRDIGDAQRSDDSTRAAKLQREYDDRILRLRVLDPAMGSGHFLIRACQFLAEEIATHPYTSDSALAEQENGESAVSFWKRRVAECCLYGVDLNPLAVELAKLALWLETVASNRPLTFLDHHLRTGNSLIGGKLTELGALPGEIELRAAAVAQQVESQLLVLLRPLAEIREMPSETVEQIKAKQKLYKSYEASREPFRLVADLWASTFAGAAASDDQYQRAIESLTQPRKFAKLSSESWFKSAIARAHRLDFLPFHWELEFLEAFYDEHGPRANGGFDAIIGNPPYEVLSERESGHDLAALRAFVDHEPTYRPTLNGKNNLYKLFICRSLELLCGGGRLGLITPMAMLGDKTTADVRKDISRLASFTGIDAFPQKDNPRNRVFPEAKLSTAVFTLIKVASNPQQFRCRVHAGRLIDEHSPGYTLSTADIALYDPVNLTIVSCSQVDWELATRIMRTGRMERLSRFAEFFQGEVNETNERARGTLIDDPDRGALVTRGASICLYVARSASQGRDLFLDVDRFLQDKAQDTKAFHHRVPRVCWQESSPQNNFRRIIAALIAPSMFCNHTVNYCPVSACKLDLHLLLGILNSQLAEWYFRLGSTNAHVSHYQVGNLPCPVFDRSQLSKNEGRTDRVCQLVRKGRFDDAYNSLATDLAHSPFALTLGDAIIEAVKRIVEIEAARGEIRRTERSSLDPRAQPYQDFIDRLFFAMAGFSEDEARGLEERLATMQ